MKIPRRETCLSMLKRYRVPPHIVIHSLQVENVARYLGDALNALGNRLNVELISAAALVHDIAKMDGLHKGLNHAKTGGEIMRKHGYHRVAGLVECHVVLPSRWEFLKVTEEEIVNYADKRVLHDRVVTLDERFGDIRRRYGKNLHSLELIDTSLQRAKQTESRIFRRLPIHPDELIAKLPRLPLQEV